MAEAGLRLEHPRKVALVTSIADQLVEHIQNGALQPGDKLPSEGQLIQMLGLGRSSAREALSGDYALRRRYTISRWLRWMLNSFVLAGMIAFMAGWSDYQWQLATATDELWLTLPVGVAKLTASSVGSIDIGVGMAGATFAFIPMLLIFLIFQSCFIKGITVGADRDIWTQPNADFCIILLSKVLPDTQKVGSQGERRYLLSRFTGRAA